MTKAEAMLSVIKEIYEGGRDIIGLRWMLLERMTELARRDNIRGMADYYKRCLASPKGQLIGERLAEAGRRSMESERARFMQIYVGKRQIQGGDLLGASEGRNA